MMFCTCKEWCTQPHSQHSCLLERLAQVNFCLTSSQPGSPANLQALFRIIMRLSVELAQGLRLPFVLLLVGSTQWQTVPSCRCLQVQVFFASGLYPGSSMRDRAQRQPDAEKQTGRIRPEHKPVANDRAVNDLTSRLCKDRNIWHRIELTNRPLSSHLRNGRKRAAESQQ